MSESKEPVKEVAVISTEKMFSIVPQNLDQAIRLATLISESDLAPKDFKGKPGNTLIAMQMGAEVGISPMQSIQNIAVINGKPSLYGSIGKGILLNHGCSIEERDIKEVEASGEACCVINRNDGSVPVTRTFSIANAKTARLWGKEGPWTNYPYRQLMWRAFWFAANDAGADFLKGLRGAEEVRDYDMETTAVKESILPPIAEPRRASENANARNAETVNKKTGEITEPDEDNTDPEDVPEGFKLMPSKMASTCETCKKGISVGDPIAYDPSKGRAHHRGHWA